MKDMFTKMVDDGVAIADTIHPAYGCFVKSFYQMATFGVYNPESSVDQTIVVAKVEPE